MSNQWVNFTGALALLLGATTALAQPAAPSDEGRRAELNSQQAAFAQHQLDENAANRRKFEEAEQARIDKINRDQAAFAQRQAAYEADKARLEHDHEEAMARWRADVAACKAGHLDHCAHN